MEEDTAVVHSVPLPSPPPPRMSRRRQLPNWPPVADAVPGATAGHLGRAPKPVLLHAAARTQQDRRDSAQRRSPGPAAVAWWAAPRRRCCWARGGRTSATQAAQLKEGSMKASEEAFGVQAFATRTTPQQLQRSRARHWSAAALLQQRAAPRASSSVVLHAAARPPQMATLRGPSVLLQAAARPQARHWPPVAAAAVYNKEGWQKGVPALQQPLGPRRWPPVAVARAVPVMMAAAKDPHQWALPRQGPNCWGQ